MRKIIFSAAIMAAGLFFCSTATAQVNERKAITQKNTIKGFSNSNFRVAYVSESGKLFTLRGVPVIEDAKISQISINPAGASLAVLYEKKPIVNIYSFSETDKLISEIKDKRKKLPADPYPTAICYGADARNMIIANALGEIVIYDTKEYQPKAYIQGEAPAKSVSLSSNNYFIASAVGNEVVVWNFQTHQVRTKLPMNSEVKDVTFSSDAALLAVVTADNKLTLFDTKTWKESKSFDSIGGSLTSPSFHPDGKYISVVKDLNQIIILNYITGRIETKVANTTDNSTTAATFFKNNSNGEVYILSNRAKQMVFWDATELTPFYSKDLTKQVDAKMNDWVKMLDGETADAYALRVNDDTRMQQQQLFAQEVATEMAGDRIAIDNPFVGAFDAAAGMLNIGFEKMQGIQLSVSEEEANQFGDAKNLKFENAVYVLNENDEFELAYVEVRNETTDKVYIYDNIGRLKLQQLDNDLDFVPLEIMQQASQEEVKLQAIKEQVVEENKEESLISDHTEINVKTEVVPDVNADGNKILNYKIGYQYEVINKEFSAKDDFPAGQFITEKSNAAMSLMTIIKQAFEGDFAKYLNEGKQVKIIITGSADASRILNTKPYDERYGKFIDEPYYKDGDLDNITVTKETGISTNEQLALMRAAGVNNYILNNIETLKKTNNTTEYHVEVAKEKGSEFRRIDVEFIIVDAFPQK